MAAMVAFAAVATFASTVATAAHAAPEMGAAPVALSVRDAIAAVLARSVAAQTARLDLRMQIRQAALARHEFLPQGTLSGQAERAGESNASNAGFASTWKLRSGAVVSAAIGRSALRSPTLPDALPQTQRTTTQSLGLVQPLLRGAGFEAATVNERLAELSAADARRGFTQSLSDLVFETVSAYFALEQAGRTVDLAREANSRLARMRSVNEALLAAGRVARTALLQNEVDEAQGAFSLAQAEQAELVARRTLLRLINRDGQDTDSTGVLLSDSFASHADGAVPSEAQAIAIALAQRSDVRSAQTALASARLAQVSARDALRDQLDVYAKTDRQRGSSAIGATQQNSTAVGVTFSMVLDKSTQRAAVDSAQTAVTKAELALAEAERNVVSQTKDAIKAIAFAQTQYRLAQRTADLAARRLDDEVEKARVGRSSATDLTQAQDSLRDARSQEVQARYAIFVARLDLQRATGTVLELWGAQAQLDALPEQN
jgi:outer membrane protein TolC